MVMRKRLMARKKLMARKNVHETVLKQYYRLNGVGLPSEDSLPFLYSVQDNWKNALKLRLMEKRQLGGIFTSYQ